MPMIVVKCFNTDFPNVEQQEAYSKRLAADLPGAMGISAQEVKVHFTTTDQGEGRKVRVTFFDRGEDTNSLVIGLVKNASEDAFNIPWVKSEILKEGTAWRGGKPWVQAL